MKLVLLLTLTSFLTYAGDCFIKTAPVLLVIDSKGALPQEAIIDSNCSERVQNQFVTLALNASGSLSEKRLNYYLQRSSGRVTLKPHLILIKQFADLIYTNLNTSDMIAKNIKQLSNKKILRLSHDHEIKLSCDNCSKTGPQNIKISLQNSKEKKELWVSLELLRKRFALRLKRTLNPFTGSLSIGLFEKVEVPLNEGVALFTDIKNLKFYRTNKTIKKGDVLKISDLSPINLVQAGRKVEVNIKRNKLLLRTIGVSKSMGKIDDLVEVYNPKTRKKYLARIIDENKVMIEL